MSVAAAEVLEIEQSRRALVALLDQLLPELRDSCDHASVAEVTWVNQQFLPSLKPRRMCLECGIEEAGWGAGYKILTASPVEIFIDRQAFTAARPFPDQSEEWAWCYGTNVADAHATPKQRLNGHHRCPDHS